MKKALLFLAACLFVVLGCERDTSEKDREQATVETNAPVRFGESFYFRVKEHNYDYNYEIIKPDGSRIDGSSYETNNARASDDGLFTLEATKSNGQVLERNELVRVIPNDIPCSPKLNVMDWPTKLYLDFDFIQELNSGDNYVIRGKSSKGYLTVFFDHPYRPKGNHTYMTSYQVSDLYQGEVEIYITDFTGQFSQNHIIESKQELHLSESNGKMTITLCDIQVIGSNSGFSARMEF